jgi:hypothetical protein
MIEIADRTRERDTSAKRGKPPSASCGCKSAPMLDERARDRRAK